MKKFFLLYTYPIQVLSVWFGTCRIPCVFHRKIFAYISQILLRSVVLLQSERNVMLCQDCYRDLDSCHQYYYYCLIHWKALRAKRLSILRGNNRCSWDYFSCTGPNLLGNRDLRLAWCKWEIANCKLQYPSGVSGRPPLELNQWKNTN